MALELLLFHTVLGEKKKKLPSRTEWSFHLRILSTINVLNSVRMLRKNFRPNRISDFLAVYKSMQMMYCLHFLQSYFQVLEECKISY